MERTQSLKGFSAFALVAFVVGSLSSVANASSFPEVWAATQEKPYSVPPQYQTTYSSFFTEGVNLIRKSAHRTLNDDSDVLPYFQKLVHPIGICFAGTWNITQQSPYSGYFASGSKGLIIIRASEAVGQPFRGDYRAFGLAGKIFPTMDPKDGKAVKTANFFTVDDLGGTKSESFMDLPKLNEPKLSFHFNTLFALPMVTTIKKAFEGEDSNIGIRPLYQISELGMDNPKDAKTPHWMMLQPDQKGLTGDFFSDFRKELRVVNYKNHEIRFGIYTSEKGDTQWVRRGTIVLNQDALSEGCDHRLHFQHPKHRD